MTAPGASALAESASDRACVRALGFPDSLERQVLACLEGHSQSSGARPSWQSLGDAAWHVEREGDGPVPAWSVWDTDPNGVRRLWLMAAGRGGLHAAARWEPGGLAWARLRLPGGAWLSLKPRAGQHPLWGRCDLVACGTEHTARLPAQDYLALGELPPLDRPAALPAGGGASLLNLLARLMAGRGGAAVRYRGPYPTAHLFDALCRSFAWQPDLPAAGTGTGHGAGTGAEDDAAAERTLADQRARLRVRFSADEWQAALEAAPSEWRCPEVTWRPDPWTPSRPHPELQVHWRRGAECIWMRGQAFTAPGRGEPAAGGCRVWATAAGGTAAGLLLLGRPWRSFVQLDAKGGLIRYDPPPEPEPQPTPLPEPWFRVACDWATVAAAPALAGTVAELAGASAGLSGAGAVLSGARAGPTPQVTLTWAPLAASLAEAVATPAGWEVRVQSGIADQFRTLAAQGRPASELAMMAVSDALGGVGPILRRLAQQRLAQQEPVQQGALDPAVLVAQGTAVQARARERLQRDLPALIAALTQGQGWVT